MKNIFKNYVYNLMYQMLLILLPFFTMPYVAKVLGANNLGLYSYTFTIVNYCILFSKLGIDNYGNRSIAKTKNKKQRSKIFAEIYVLQLIFGLLSLAIYIIIYFSTRHEYGNLLLFQLFWLIGSLLDITWVFFGMENFKFIVSRNTFVKLISFVLIFTFVKNSSDLWKYALILSGSSLLGFLITWPNLLKVIDLELPSFKNLRNHLKPITILFVPIIGTSFLTIFNKVILGNISSIKYVGYYEIVEKIVAAPKGLISSLGIVMLPRMTKIYEEDANKITNQSTTDKYLKVSLLFVLILSFAITFGIIGVSDNFISLFYGSEYLRTAQVLKIMIVTLIFYAVGNVVRTQFLLPKNMDREYTISIVLGAITNIIFCFILIPKINVIGASISLLLGEIVLCLYQCWRTKKVIDYYSVLNTVLPFFILSIFMYLFVYLIGIYLNFNSILIELLVQILIGAFVYIVGAYTIITKTKNVNLIYIKNIIINIFGKT